MTAKGKSLRRGTTTRSYQKMVSQVECFKKFVSMFLLVLMALTMLFTMGVYCYNLYNLRTGAFFLARTRVDVEEIIDFETVKTNKVLYFLYRNTTEGASDVNSENNYYIVPNVTELCSNECDAENKDCEEGE